MTITFYYAPQSTADVTSAVLKELDHDQAEPLTTRVTLSFKAGETRTESYLKVNPNGHVPAIVHDGVAIWESAAITMYLGEMFGEKRGLYPALGPARGEAMKWIVWSNVVLSAQGMKLMSFTWGCPKEESQEAKEAREKEAAKVKEEITKSLGILDKALEGKDFLLGEGYCLADTHLWCLMGWIKMMAITLDAFPNADRWDKAVGARPALKHE